MGTLVVLALVLAVGYIGACAWWPFMACRRCGGSGRKRSPSGKAWRSCPRCGGSGNRIRFGRRAYELFTRG